METFVDNPVETAREAEPVAVPRDPILAKAVGVLRRKGWTRAKLRDSRTGQVCAIGAIASVRLSGIGGDLPGNQYPRHSPKRRRAVEILARSLGWDRRRTKNALDWITAWNDEPDRTAEEVEEAIERAAWL